MKKAVIFDMDGVLVDSEPFYQQRRERFMRSKGLTIPEEGTLVGIDEKTLWERMVPDDAATRERWKKEYRQFCKDWPIPYDTLADPQAVPLLRELKRRGMKLAIASSSSEWMIRRMASMLGIEGMVDHIQSGETCGSPKPDPEIYRKTLAALGTAVRETVAVEDSPIGILAALGAGLEVYAPRPKYGQLDQSKASAVLPELKNLLMYL